jgi:hypothetical protein
LRLSIPLANTGVALETSGSFAVQIIHLDPAPMRERARLSVSRLKNQTSDMREMTMNRFTHADQGRRHRHAGCRLLRVTCQEFIVVALVCAVFLFQLRSALVAIVCLPLGVLIAFIIMYYQGMNANIMSLGGIAIAIGAMVDAVVVNALFQREVRNAVRQ